jgi:hypothetical protein
MDGMGCLPHQSEGAEVGGVKCRTGLKTATELLNLDDEPKHEAKFKCRQEKPTVSDFAEAHWTLLLVRHEFAQALGDVLLEAAPSARADEPLVDFELNAEVVLFWMAPPEPSGQAV